MPRTAALVSVAALALAAAAADAAITGVTGMTTQVAPPPSCTFGNFTAGTVHVWDELQGINVAGMPADLTVNPGSSAFPTPGPVNGLVDVHFMHYNDFVVPVTGTVTFNGPIIGVAYNNVFLDISDPLGAPGTVYPTGDTWRGINTIANPGASVISILGNTLTFSLEVVPGATDFDQVRVYTRVVPTPGAAATLAAAGVLGLRRRRR
jgi:hypothetical protein